MGAEKCLICNEIIRSNSASIKCSTCAEWVHKKCTGLTSEEFSKLANISKKKKHTWNCQVCSEHSDSIFDQTVIEGTSDEEDSQIGKIESLFQKYFLPFKVEMEKKLKLIQDQLEGVLKDNNILRAKVKEIEESSTNKTNISTPCLTNTDQVLSEITEREARKKNVIIFGLPENQDSQKDKSGCLEILKTLDPQFESIPKLFRLGKQPSNDARPRPIKIILDSSDKALNLIKNAKILKSTERFKNITVTSDKTPTQQQQYKDLKVELNRRILNGEANLKIKYRNGEPKIVKN